MQAELNQFFSILWLLVLLGIGGFFLRVILSILLRKRAAPGLVPRLDEVGRPDATTRFVALIGQNAAPTQTMGTVRLRATLGIRLAYWIGGVVMALIVNSMGAPVFGIETALLLVVLLTALHTSLYEISYDRQTITLPRWWFGKTTRKWSDLLSVTSPDGWFMKFHFEGGTSIFVHKYVVGHRQLLETARKAIREN